MKKSFNFYASFTMLIVGIVLACLGVSHHWKSFHNVDTVWNACVQANDRCVRGELVDFRSQFDYTSESRKVSLVDIYGSAQMIGFKSLTYLLVGAFFIGFGLRGIIDNEQVVKPRNKVLH